MASPSVGEQLATMLRVLRHNDQDIISSNQSVETTFMSLLWPLLPLLPPQPPPLLTELLGETYALSQEKCDVCGKTGKTFMKCCGEAKLSAPVSSSGTELKHRYVVKQRHSSLDEMVDVIEHKMDETLEDIEETTFRTDELNKLTKDLLESGKSNMSDAELLKRLQSLIKQKEAHEKRVKALEIQEQQMKESLITAIKWAKEIKPKDQKFSNGKEQNTDDEHKEGISDQNHFLDVLVNDNITDMAQSLVNELIIGLDNLENGEEKKDRYQQDLAQDEQELQTKNIHDEIMVENGENEINMSNLSNLRDYR